MATAKNILTEEFRKWKSFLASSENARCQTFPDEWQFCGSVQSQYKQVGNAVPVNLAYEIGLEIHKSLEGDTQSRKTNRTFLFSNYLNNSLCLYIEPYRKSRMEKSKVYFTNLRTWQKRRCPQGFPPGRSARQGKLVQPSARWSGWGCGSRQSLRSLRL